MKAGELTLKEASEWATAYLGKNVTSSNIAYLVQYGRIGKIGNGGTVCVSRDELIRYYGSRGNGRQMAWRKQLGDDLNWELSFEQHKEAETTKHVHRLHPYKGKFIPQLVEYFLDEHTDNIKKASYFKRGDIVLDPFAGSGTTLVQACELGLNAIGVDVAAFNVFMSNCKIGEYDIREVAAELERITRKLRDFSSSSPVAGFDAVLTAELGKFNARNFPSPEYKRSLHLGEITAESYGKEKEQQFRDIFDALAKRCDIKLTQHDDGTFLGKWYPQGIRDEINFVFKEIKTIKAPGLKKIAALVLSRTMRSSRATTHADLATLVSPVFTPYYCSKHGKICRPLLSMVRWWSTYAQDTIKRLSDFGKLRTATLQVCLLGDSRTIDIQERLGKTPLGRLVSQRKIKGIFSSPPYVGLIDYHQQHAYAYDLFGFERRDGLEIGPLYKGQGKEARESYVQSISDVLVNCRRFLADDFEIFLVANDKCDLYPQIAEKSGLRIVNKFKRPVLNRTEKDKGAYSETIFHLRGQER